MTIRGHNGMYYGTAAEWAVDDVVLELNVWGVETDTHVTKLGDGESTWSELPQPATTLPELITGGTP